MTTNVTALLSYLNSLSDERNELSKLLGTDSNSAYAYFILPLGNLIQSLASGKLLPRNSIKSHQTNFIDLSSQSVQSNRKKEIALWSASSTGIQFQIHDCVNLFLNPINQTYFQFLRSAKLSALSSNNPKLYSMCILSFKIENLLSLEKAYWGFSSSNLAVNNSKTTSSLHEIQRFKWRDIYSLNLASNKKSDNKSELRRAELVVHPSAGDGIPANLINQVNVFEKDVQAVVEMGIKPDMVHAIKPSGFYDLSDPFYYDFKLAGNILSLESIQQNKQTLIPALVEIQKFGDMNGKNLKRAFADSAIAEQNLHGVGHITRVMFWVSYLAFCAQNQGIAISTDNVQTALFAAFYHDVSRRNNSVEESHGQKAVMNFQTEVKRLLSSSQFESWKIAVEYHSRHIQPKKMDIVYQLLMDADAIERGRFAQSDKPNGCDTSKLLLPFFKNTQILAEITWAGYWLPRVTKFWSWTGKPSTDIHEVFKTSLRAALAHGQLKNIQKNQCQQILSKLD